MQTVPARSLIVALIVSVASVMGTEARAADGPAWLGDLAGAWEIAPDANRLLGYSGEEREEASFERPLSFTLSVDEKLGQNVNAEKLAVYTKIFENLRGRHPQQIRATGEVQWKFEFFESSHNMDSQCFITHSEGSTFLWCGAAHIVIYGGKISLIRGRDRDHDLLVIDFNPQREMSGKEWQSQDTVVYKRVKE